MIYDMIYLSAIG